MKREKRNYIIVLMMSSFMIFTLAFALKGFEEASRYGETKGIIKSVTVRQVESGSYDDRTYYTESSVRYLYTIYGREYLQTTDIRADYSGREGDEVTVIYDKQNPRKSDIGSRDQSLSAGIIALLSTIVLLIYIIYDITMWVRKRKAENARIAWQNLSYNERLNLDAEKNKKKKISILLILASALLTFLLLFFAFPLLAFTIAWIIDWKLCYPESCGK